MKSQWLLVLSFIFAIIIAILAIANVTKIPVNYIFGKTEWPLILVILGATLLGILLSASFGLYRSFNRSKEIKNLKNSLLIAEQKVYDLEAENQHFIRVENSMLPKNEAFNPVDETITIDTEYEDVKKLND